MGMYTNLYRLANGYVHRVPAAVLFPAGGQECGGHLLLMDLGLLDIGG